MTRPSKYPRWISDIAPAHVSDWDIMSNDLKTASYTDAVSAKQKRLEPVDRLGDALGLLLIPLRFVGAIEIATT